MSYHFSQNSQAKLLTCHADLQRLFNEVIKHYDCTIITGFRSEAAQMEAREAGLSTKPWGGSKHNLTPSQAVDVGPYPLNWKDTKSFYHFAGFVLGIAKMMGIPIRCGADWDGDNDLNDQTLMDLVHFELVIPRA